MADEGAIMGPKIHSVDETVFDSITDQSAYWAGFLLTAVNIYTDKIGYPQISLTLAERGRERLVKLRKFLKCSNQIVLKHTKVYGKVRFCTERVFDQLARIFAHSILENS